MSWGLRTAKAKAQPLGTADALRHVAVVSRGTAWRRWFALRAFAGSALAALSVMLFAGAGSAAVGPASSAVATMPAHDVAPPLLVRERKPIHIDRAEFEAFLDEFIASRMEREHVPGVVFYMVQDGEEFLAKGYGYADLERNIPMDPRATVLAVGSLTKLFTATACMQLVEQGKLDLFADVNDYLSAFTIDRSYDQPITLATLLEHTDGFDVVHIGVAARGPNDLMPLEHYLARRLPPRVRQPGMSAVYGEHGMALAGYLVEIAAGMPYVEYMRTQLLDVVGMKRSDFQLRPDMRSNVCVAYLRAGDRQLPVVPEHAYHIVPAAGLYTTAEDLGRFMIAHLERGKVGGARVLSETTADLMCQQKFGVHPLLSAWSYGFHTRMHAGEFCIEHGGMSLRTICQLLIMPERRVGFAIAGNSLSMQLHKEFLSAFLKRYFGDRNDAPPFDPLASGVIDPLHFEGWYEAMHRSYSSLERLNDISRQTRVEVTSPTTLTTRSTHDDVVKWFRIAPTVYESEDGEARMAFVHDRNDNVVGLLNGPHECARLAWWATVPFQRGLFGALAIVFLTGLAAPALGAVIGRKKPSANAISPRRRLQTLLMCGLCGANLLFFAGLAFVLQNTSHLEFIFGVPIEMQLLLWLPVVTVAIAPAVTGFALSSWIDGDGSLLRRAHESLIAVAGLAFIAQAAHWNLLGFNV
jgi:CubicO group peptidase (beta-lactamase class C family)